MSIKRYVVAASIVFIPLIVFAGDSSIESFREKLDPLIKESINALKTYESNGFSIQTFKASEISAELKRENDTYSKAIIKGDQTPSIHIEIDRKNKNSFGFAVFDSRTNEPIISTTDAEGDGKLDDLTYTVMDDHGRGLIQITDYGMDGSLDIKIHLDSNYGEIIYRDEWLKIEKKGDERGVYIDGAFRPLKNDGRRLYIE